MPEEFAAAYRAAYERALAAPPDDVLRRDDPAPVAEPDVEPLAPPVAGPVVSPAADDRDPSPSLLERVTHARWFVPLLLGLLAVLLIFGAYTVGRSLAGPVAGAGGPRAPPTLATGAGGDQGEQAAPGAWTGKVTPLRDVTARVGCTSKAGVDASGAKVSYAAGNLTDGAADTTWRCGGKAIGQKITLDLGEDVPIGEVGLIPGYAKTDDTSKADRYAENNRITRVRWTIGDRRIVQEMSADPKDRSLRLLRVPKTSADQVELEILAVTKGPRNTTAISEIRVSQAG